MGRAQRLRAPTPLRNDAHNRTNATYRSQQYAVNPTSSNNTGVFYLTIVRCTVHTPTVQCITLRCVQFTELPQHHKEYSYMLARQPQIDSSYSNNIIRCSTATRSIHTAAITNMADLNKSISIKHLGEVTWYMSWVASTGGIARREPWRFRRLSSSEMSSTVSVSLRPAQSLLHRRWA